MNELISIIVPVYNVDAYLVQCIESIIGQTYQNLEILLVNDGSTDSGGKICDEYAQKDKRVKVLHKKNEGVSKARNAALDLMKGAYCIFVDGDDWISQNLIEELYQQCQESNADMVFANQIFMNEENRPQRSIYQYKTKQTFHKNEAIIDFLQNSAAVLGRLYTKEAMNKHRFPEGVKLAEDEAVEIEILLNIQKICFNDKAEYYRRVRVGSASRKKFDENDRKAIEIHEQVARKILCSFEQMNLYVSRFMAARYMETILKVEWKDKENKQKLKKRYRYWYKQGKWYPFESYKMNLRFLLLAISPSLYQFIQRVR